VDLSTGIITTVAGSGEQGFSGDGGQATDAALDTPQGLALDSQGHLFLADSNNHRIRRIDLETGIITTVAGNGVDGFGGDGGPASQASFSGPADVALDAEGNLYIADTFNGTIHRVEAATQIITQIAGNGEEIFGGDGGPALDAGLSFPFSIVLDPEGNLYISDTFNNRIRAVRGPVP